MDSQSTYTCLLYTSCKENGLSVIPPSQNKGMGYKEYTEAKRGTSWKQKLKQTIDRLVITAKDYDDFLRLMQEAGYEIKTGKYISFRAEGQERFTRSKTIGENYTEERIKERIAGRTPRRNRRQTVPKGISLIGDIQERIRLIDSKGYEYKAKLTILKEAARTLNYLTENNLLQYADLEKKVEDVHSSYDRTGKELKGVEARLREVQPLIKNISNYQDVYKRQEYSTRIYQVYLKYIAPEDIVVYSIDEVFMDVTDYLNTYKLSAHDLAMKIILDVLETTGITATAGIGTNLFLCKVAMDIVAKHIPADKNGVRIAELDEMKFRRELWAHQPLTDFWRVGRGIAKKLEQNGMFTMGDVALCSERNEDLLYKLFGKNAELLIDHAWGWEPTTIEAIKAYRPSSNSISSGQVLHCPYEPQKAKLVVREMTDLLVLDLVDKGLVTDQMVLTVGYDIENLTDPARRAKYHGAVEKDPYGREIPKQAHGSINLDGHTSSTRKIMCAVSELFDRIVDKNLLVRRMYVVANHVLPEADAPKKNDGAVQLDLFTDYAAEEKKQKAENAALERERKIQAATLAIKKKYGKNAILKAMNLEEGATAKDRNAQIGGHKA